MADTEAPKTASFDIGEAGQAAGERLSIFTTQPARILRHNISDEELDMLCEGRRDFVLEFLWIAIGTFVGSSPTALSALVDYFSETSTQQIPLDELAQIVLFFVGLVSTITLGIVSFNRGRRAKSLQAQIRDRTARREA